MSKAEKQSPPSVLGCAIMQLLSRHPASGYDLKSKFFSSVGHGWHAYDTQIYRELRRLEENGYVSGEEASGRAGPKRRIYTLTDRGRDALADWLASPIDAVRYKDEVSLRVWTAELFPPGALAAYLSSVIEQWRESLEHQVMSLAALRSDPESDRADVRARCMAIEYSVTITQARLNWARQTLLSVEALPLKPDPEQTTAGSASEDSPDSAVSAVGGVGRAAVETAGPAQGV